LLKIGDEIRISGCDYGEIIEKGEDYIGVMVTSSHEESEGAIVPFYAELYRDDFNDDLVVEIMKTSKKITPA